MAVSRTAIKELMSVPVRTIGPDASVRAASQLMVSHGIGALPVVDEGELRGIVSERDVLAAAGADEVEATVASWMTPEPVAAALDDGPTEAFERMRDGGFRHLPVVADGTVVGIVSIRDLLALARLEPVEHPGHLDAPKGLAGVIVAETDIGDVRGEEGFFHYRQYDATELARQRTFEDVWYLLVHGRLPTGHELSAFAKQTAALRAVPARTAAMLPEIAATAPTPVDALRTAVSLVASELGLQPILDTAADDLRDQGIHMAALVPTLATALYRLQLGEEPLEPDADLAYGANYLWMMSGRVPSADESRAIEQYLTATIDHGFNASTFTARVITSTGADLGAALVGAIGALSGPLHGGAPSRALGLLDEIGRADATADVIRRKLMDGDRIMGFGHRVYKTRDPRSQLLREVALRLGGERAAFAAEVEDVVVDTLAELKPGRQLYANVEYYAGVVFEQLGLPPELFTPTFVCSRTIGWTAHVLEQAAENRLIRPAARYVGVPAPTPVPARA